MQEAVKAYARTAQIARSPRDLEGALLLKAASQLQALKDNWSARQEPDELDAALHYNRKLWTVFVGSVADPENPLPTEIKNNIASLGAYIFHHTMMVQKDPAPEKLTSLININREIAAGLHGSV
jgi:flagellar protein FlaF